MTNVKNAILAGMVLAAMSGAPAFAHDNDRDCFYQRTGNKSVKICMENDGHQKNRTPDFGWAEKNHDRNKHEAPVIQRFYYGKPVAYHVHDHWKPRETKGFYHRWPSRWWHF